MRWPIIFFSLFVVVLQPVGHPARAGQDNPRLDRLFHSLVQAKNQHQALLIESRIWKIWLLAGDPAVDVEMARGIDYLNAGDLESALTSFNKIIKMEPDLAEGWNKRATVYYLMGDLNRSVRDIEHTLALEPRHFGAFAGLGMIYLAIGDDHAALRAFEKVLKIDPYYGNVENQVRRLRQKIKGQPT